MQRHKKWGLADELFSRYIRERDKWTCQRCGRRNVPKWEYDCAHIFIRAWISTRLDYENATGLCRPCHEYLDRHTQEKYEWWESKIGAERFHNLRIRAKKPGQWKIHVDDIKAQLKEDLRRLRVKQTQGVPDL